jgi:predicted RNA-binding protein with PUA-like domain
MADTWLFQIDPKKARLFEANLRVGGEQKWDVTRYRSEIRPGDNALVWRDADNAGIIALGQINSEIFEEDDPDFPDRKFWTTVKYTHIFRKPLSRNELKRNTALHYMQVISIPFALNPFAVTPDEWAELRQLLGIA